MNDANQPLIGLLHTIVENPDEISLQYEKLWYAQLGQERDFYDHIRAEFNRSHSPEHFLYLLARCVKSAVRYNGAGEFNQSPDNRRRGSKPDRMAKQIQLTSEILKGRVTFSAVDYVESLSGARPQDIVYMDPPYQGVSTNRDRRYLESLQYEDFVEALLELNRNDISYVISYDGRTGGKAHGKPLPSELELGHFEIDAGRSTQATFLGKADRTFESLYLSPALLERLGGRPQHLEMTREESSPTLFEL